MKQYVIILYDYNRRSTTTTRQYSDPMQCGSSLEVTTRSFSWVVQERSVVFVVCCFCCFVFVVVVVVVV